MTGFALLLLQIALDAVDSVADATCDLELMRFRKSRATLSCACKQISGRRIEA